VPLETCCGSTPAKEPRIGVGVVVDFATAAADGSQTFSARYDVLGDRCPSFEPFSAFPDRNDRRSHNGHGTASLVREDDVDQQEPARSRRNDEEVRRRDSRARLTGRGIGAEPAHSGDWSYRMKGDMR